MKRHYGTLHRKRRQFFKPVVEAGMAFCRRCGELIEPGTPWDLGHSDDRSTSAPEHESCNRAVMRNLTRHSRAW